MSNRTPRQKPKKSRRIAVVDPPTRKARKRVVPLARLYSRKGKHLIDLQSVIHM